MGQNQARGIFVERLKFRIIIYKVILFLKIFPGIRVLKFLYNFEI